MDLNLELSRMLNAAMEEFDEQKGASASMISGAAENDLQEKSANTVFWGMLSLFVLGLLLSMLEWVAQTIGPTGEFRAVLLVLSFILFWTGFFYWWRQRKVRARRNMTPQLLQVMDQVHALSVHLKPRYGMLGQNIADVERRMLKIFSGRNHGLIAHLLALCVQVFGSKEFALAGHDDAATRQHLADLNDALLLATQLRK